MSATRRTERPAYPAAPAEAATTGRQASVQHSFVLADCAIETVFELFCDPQRLDDLTPSWFGLRVREGGASPLRVGSSISYRMRWRGLPMTWQSLITQLETPGWLVYEQSQGPFREFRHEHLFLQRGGDTVVTDRIIYSVLGGQWVAQTLVKADLERILRYRERAAIELLARAQATSASAPL